MPVFSQNTKGDKPVNNKGKVREARFKTQTKQGDKARTRDVARRRLRTKNKSSANRAATNYRSPRTAVKAGGKERGDRAARPTGPIRSAQPSDKQKPWHGTRVPVRSATGKTRNVFPQSGPYVRNSTKKPKDKQRPVKTYRVNGHSSTGRNRNVYPQRGAYVRNHSRTPKSAERTGKVRTVNVSSQTGRNHRIQSNRPIVARIQALQGNAGPGPGKRKKVIPRTASHAHVGKRSINPIARFHRKTKKGEQAHIKDIAGRPLRTKNFESRRPDLLSPTVKPYMKRKRVGDRAYHGQAAGKHVSVTSTRPRAWHGDIAGRNIKGKNFHSKIKTGGNVPARGYRTATRASEKRTGKAPLAPRTPGIGASGIGNFRGTLKGQRRAKGGGSISGKLWNNKNSAIPPRGPSSETAKAGRYSGNVKMIDRRGAISQRKFNFPGQQNRFSRSPGFQNQGEEFNGFAKARRPVKGGKSISGKLWNNKNSAIPGRTPGIGASRIQGFQGTLKAHRPAKGGGSISGKLWNNKNSAIPARGPSSETAKAGRYSGNVKVMDKRGAISQRKFNFPGQQNRFSRSPGFQNQGEEFTGFAKARRPVKGGKSISGKLWNNKNSAIPGRGPSSETAKAGSYSGNVKVIDKRGNISQRKFNFPGRQNRFSRSPGFQNQGEEFTGFVKARRPEKGGKSISGKLWNNKETPIPSRTPSSEAAKAGSYSGNVKVIDKRGNISQRKFNYPGRVKRFGLGPGFQNQGEEFDGFIKTKGEKEKRGEISQKEFNYPGKTKRFSIQPAFNNQGEEFTGFIKVKKSYVKNENSADEALKKAHPSKSTYKAGKLQVRVQQFNYVHNKSSADEALNVREPGKAFGKATDYQGNVKMKKFDLFGKKPERHPDTKFVVLNKNNVAEERSLRTNFRLLWARLFKKSDTQPDHLKDKEHKPRYDKREQGLWYE